MRSRNLHLLTGLVGIGGWLFIAYGSYTGYLSRCGFWIAWLVMCLFSAWRISQLWRRD